MKHTCRGMSSNSNEHLDCQSSPPAKQHRRCRSTLAVAAAQIVKALTGVRARSRRIAASADGGFLGFPELARGIAAASGSKLYTDQAHYRSTSPPPQNLAPGPSLDRMSVLILTWATGR